MKMPIQYFLVGGSSTDPATRFVKYGSWQQVADLFTPWADGLLLLAVAGLSDKKRPETLTDIGMAYYGQRLLVEVDTGEQERRDGWSWLMYAYYTFGATWLKANWGRRFISNLGAVPESKAWVGANRLWGQY